jgi:cob(I)alamin adenosyltransferase
MIQVYTGSGKGKSTAAFGLCLRASGAGKRVFIAQFLKGRLCGEIRAFKLLPGITLEQFGVKSFIYKKPSLADIKAARLGLTKVRKIIAGRLFSVVVLDEVNIAMHMGILQTEEVLALLRSAGGIARNRFLRKRI